MKNQNDLIFSIVFGVLGLIAFGIAFGTKPEPPAIAAPPSIVTADAALPATAVTYGTALPNASTAGGTSGGPGSSSSGPSMMGMSSSGGQRSGAPMAMPSSGGPSSRPQMSRGD